MDNTKLREYFAGLALQVLLVKFDPNHYPLATIAKDSYRVADAMLLESVK